MDSRLQEQLRAARAEGEPGAWLAAGRSLLRSGEGEAAGEAVAALASDRDRMRELLRSEGGPGPIRQGADGKR